MKKSEVKAGSYYEGRGGIVVVCLDLGEGRFPRIPKFRVVYPFANQERLLEPRELIRQLSDREAQAFKPKN